MKLSTWIYSVAVAGLLLLGGSAPAVGQTVRYTNSRLQRLAEVMTNRYGVNCSRAATVRLGMHQIVVEKDAFGEVYHIGFRLFSRELMEQSPSPVYRFAERYLLELYLMKSHQEVAARLKEEKVELRFFMQEGALLEQLRKAITAVQRELSFVMTTDNSFYTLLWREQGRPCFLMRFPIQYELLWGMGKQECENSFQQRLQTFSVPKQEPIAAPDEATMEKQKNGCLRCPGDWYEIAEMTTDTYYRRNGKRLEPVCGENYPVESVHNLFTLLRGGRLTVEITQRRYGGQKTECTAPLAQLLALAQEEGCEAYVGIEQLDEQQIAGCVILINRSMGYNHVGYFSIPLIALKPGSNAAFPLELFTYVPTHNIKNMYEERSQPKRTMKSYLR